MAESASQIVISPGHQLAKQREFSGIPSRGRSIDDFLLVFLKLPGVMIPGLPVLELPFLVLKTSTISQLFAVVQQFAVEAFPRDHRPTQVFCTTDVAGIRSPGKLTDQVGAKLQEGQVLFLHYFLHPPRPNETKGHWAKMAFSLLFGRAAPCHHCQSQLAPYAVFSGFSILRICEGCLNQSKGIQGSSEKYTYICRHCGAKGVGLKFRGAKLLDGTCGEKCRHAPLQRTCSHCDLPTERSRKCSRCRKISYCSVECQRADWSRHKLECSAEPGQVA